MKKLIKNLSLLPENYGVDLQKEKYFSIKAKQMNPVNMIVGFAVGVFMGICLNLIFNRKRPWR